MALDHYVSQVHLRNFGAQANGRLNAIRKADLKRFTCHPKDVCRTEEGSTNAYLTEPRIIEEFLRTIEPNYNVSVAKLRRGEIDREAVYVIAGFAAYVVACSPGAMRINSGPLAGSLEATANILDERGALPRAPETLGGKTVSELLADGTIKHVIDQKYPQAISINSILHDVGSFGNFDWDILLNDDPGNPFFTSDYPVAIEETADLRVLNRVVPLAPDVAIRIMPDLNRESLQDLSFPGFRCRRRKLKGVELHDINRLIVRCAESLVFFSDDLPWVTRFVERNRRHRIEPTVRKISTDRGIMVWTRLEVRAAEAA